MIDEYQSESGCLKDEQAPSVFTLCNAVISRVTAAKSKSQPTRPSGSGAESVAGSAVADSNASGKRSVRRSNKAKTTDNRTYPCPENVDPDTWATLDQSTKRACHIDILAGKLKPEDVLTQEEKRIFASWRLRSAA